MLLRPATLQFQAQTYQSKCGANLGFYSGYSKLCIHPSSGTANLEFKIAEPGHGLKLYPVEISRNPFFNLTNLPLKNLIKTDCSPRRIESLLQTHIF